jgi:hypothetical protein
VDVIIGNEKRDGIDFRLTLKKFNDKTYISRKSLLESLNYTNNSKQLYARTESIPFVIRGSRKYYSLTNALEYLDNVHEKTRSVTMLLLMYITQELTCLQ